MKKIETERKYVISKPDISALAAQSGFTSSEITQIYLKDEEKTHRIRKRVYSDGQVEYTENTKQRISHMSSVESEREIDAEVFERLKADIEPLTHPVIKKRITFEFVGKTFEIDIYPEWERSAILEVELKSENEKIEFPEFINVLKEVTGMREYSNHSMAYKFPKEL